MECPVSEKSVLADVSDGVATVTLNRPDALNSFTREVHAALWAALDRVEAEGARAMILTGAGRGFCAGQDLNERRRKEGDPPPDLGESLEERYNPLIRRLVAFPVPTIAAVNGVAAGAGCSLALSCDLSIAARAAKFVQAFAKVGLIPDSGATWMLPRLVGRARAMGMVLTAEPVGAEEAARIGLIWKVVDDADLMATAGHYARQLADGPALGLKRMKELMTAALTNDLDTQLDLERDTQRELGVTADYAEAVTAFLEKRKPLFGKD